MASKIEYGPWSLQLSMLPTQNFPNSEIIVLALASLGSVWNSGLAGEHPHFGVSNRCIETT